MTAAAEIMRKASVLLLDEDHVRWTLPELADWLNDGIKAIILAKPSASSRTLAVELQPGTLQRVPTVGDPKPFSLLRIVRNLKNLGDPPSGGRVVTPTTRETLDAHEPNWHDTKFAKFKTEARQFVFSEDDPLVFYVYPGNTGDGIVEAVVSTVPALLAAEGSPDLIASYAAEISLPPIYDVPLIDYVAHKAQAKDDTQANASRSIWHYNQFATAIGIKVQVDNAMSPSFQSARK